MAKKKPQETGPGVFMILALIFFILVAAVLGVTTYLGFEGESKWQEEAKKAGEKEKTAAKNAEEMTMRLDLHRIANGVADAKIRDEFNGGSRTHQAAILEEHKALMDALGAANTFPTPNAFQFPLVVAPKDGGESMPAPAPNKSVPAIAKQWAQIAKDMKAQRDAAVDARKKAELASQASQDAKDKAEETFNQKIADLSAQIKAKSDAMDKAFANLKVEADKAGINFKKQADEWADAKAKLDDSINGLKNDLISERKRLYDALHPDASDILVRFERLDLAKVAERMGTITDKSETFVTINFAKPMNLIAGQTFVVIAPTGSLVEVIEREKVLEKHHHEFLSLGPRDPFTDNELVKGMVEITDVVSRYGARARITQQDSPIRNPIGRGDQLFNIALSTGEKDHVAFAGIIDLDGDGRPDNEDFIRILERNNLVVDAYLDLKTGVVKNRPGSDGIDFKTKFLIIGSDAPIVGNVKVMIDKAKEKGVQLIDARMFLNLIGVKPPSHPAPPAYSTVTLGGEGSKNVDPEKDPMAPMPPVVPEAKKKN
jgi:hypothetical protein